MTMRALDGRPMRAAIPGRLSDTTTAPTAWPFVSRTGAATEKSVAVRAANLSPRASLSPRAARRIGALVSARARTASGGVTDVSTPNRTVPTRSMIVKLECPLLMAIGSSSWRSKVLSRATTAAATPCVFAPRRTASSRFCSSSASVARAPSNAVDSCAVPRRSDGAVPTAPHHPRREKGLALKVRGV